MPTDTTPNVQRATAHTPGPLYHRATASVGPQYAIYGDHGRTIAIVYAGDNAEADAKLYAAAPDLLAACQQIVDAWDGGECGDWRGALDHAYDAARAAIARATGE